MPATAPPERLPSSQRPIKAGGNSHARLDPHGIYGTRSAHRLRASRRRRSWQRNFFVLLFVAILALAWSWLRMPRVPNFGPEWSRAYPLSPAAPPELAGDGQTLLVPTHSGALYAVSTSQKARNEPPRAVFAAAFPLQAQPLCSGPRVFVPCQDGALYGVEWKTGRSLWRVATPAALTTRPIWLRLPPLAERPQAIPALVSPTPQPATLPTSHPIPSPIPSPAPVARPVVAALPVAALGAREIVVAANDEGLVIAVEAGSGRKIWSRDLGGPAGNALAASGGPTPSIWVPLLAGVASRGGLACLDARDGRLKWKFPADARSFGAGLGAPALENGPDGAAKRVYFATDDGALLTLDARDGRKIRKSFATPLPGGSPKLLISLRAAPVLLEKAGLVVVGGSDGGWRAFETATGRLRWSFDAGVSLRLSAFPIHFQNRAALLASGNGLWVLEAATGTPLAHWKPGGTDLAGIMAAGTQFLTLSSNGDLNLFNGQP